MTKATTVYLDTKILHAIKLKAVEAHSSVSRLINNALRYSLNEDRLDLEAIKKRKHENSRSFEAVLKDLKKDGLL